MKRKIQSLLLALALACSGASAQSTGTIDIVFNGTSATVSIPTSITGVTSYINGANVSLTSTTQTTEYTYRVSGTSTDGSLTINGSYKLTLVLAGITLTNAHGGAAIDIECGKRISVVMEEGSVNTLSDAPLGSQKAAFYFKGHPEFEGGGTLNVTGKLKHAISAKEYLELKGTTGIINILGAVSDGIHCGKGAAGNANNYFEMSGGTVNITNVCSDGIDSDDFGVVKIKGGALSINVKDGGSGIKADSTLTIKGGSINIAVAGSDADGIRSDYAINICGGNTDIFVGGDGSKGIKSKTQTTSTVNGGGTIHISGGTIHIEHSGDTFTETTGETSSCVGITADKTLTQTDGTVSILAMGTDCQAYRGKEGESLTGGVMKVTRIPWKIATRDYEYDMTVYGIVKSGDSNLTDYSGVAVGAFLGDDCVGYGDFETADYGILRVRSHSTDSEEVTFKYYDWSNASEAGLAADRAITFSPAMVYGSPSEPVALLLKPRVKLGDVNGDGDVNVTDVMMTVGYILGNVPNGFIRDAGDINGDNDINVTDVMMIVNIILGLI